MSFRDALGLIFCGAGVVVGTLGYRALGLQWYFAALILIAIGVVCIWTEARDRRLRKIGNEGPGDWGDRHYISGEHATDSGDHFESSAD